VKLGGDASLEKDSILRRTGSGAGRGLATSSGDGKEETGAGARAPSAAARKNKESGVGLPSENQAVVGWECMTHRSFTQSFSKESLPSGC